MTDTIAVLLIVAAAPAQTAFVILYGVGSPWWRSVVGRALFTKALALALLIDISVAYHFLGDNYALREVVRLSVFALIAIGTWLQLGALIYERRRRGRDRFAGQNGHQS